MDSSLSTFLDLMRESWVVQGTVDGSKSFDSPNEAVMHLVTHIEATPKDARGQTEVRLCRRNVAGDVTVASVVGSRFTIATRGPALPAETAAILRRELAVLGLREMGVALD